MIKKLRAAWHWIKALDAAEADDSQRSVHHIAIVERLAGLRPSQLAFKAQQLIVLREYVQAEHLLSETLRIMGKPRNANERYVEIICRLWREENFRDIPEANSLWAEAVELDCSPSLRRYLLLREPPGFILAGTSRMPASLPMPDDRDSKSA